MAELFGIDWDAPLPTDDDEVESIIAPDIPNPLTVAQFVELQATVHPSTSNSNYGLDYYIEVVRYSQSRV